MKPAPSPSAAPARLQGAWQPGGELARGAGTLPPQMFLHAGALLFSKRLFQAGSPALPYANTFLHKQQIVLLLSFSGFGRNGNRLLQRSLQSPFSSTHVDAHSPWLPAVCSPVLPLPPWAQPSLCPQQRTTAAPSPHGHALPCRFSAQAVNEQAMGRRRLTDTGVMRAERLL